MQANFNFKTTTPSHPQRRLLSFRGPRGLVAAGNPDANMEPDFMVVADTINKD